MYTQIKGTVQPKFYFNPFSDPGKKCYYFCYFIYFSIFFCLYAKLSEIVKKKKGKPSHFALGHDGNTIEGEHAHAL